MGGFTLNRVAIIATAILLTLGCGQAPQKAEPSTPEPDMPPSFLDEAPPPPTSATEILGGGTLVLPDGSFVNDALIVITNGKLIAWGKRGEVDVPNDSIGYDLRGKWIQTDELAVGAAADLRFSERTRGMNEVSQEIVGGYREGSLDLASD